MKKNNSPQEPFYQSVFTKKSTQKNKPAMAESKNIFEKRTISKKSIPFQQEKSLVTVKKSSPIFLPLAKTFLQKETAVLENFDSLIQSVHPLSAKQMIQLPKIIRSLSHQLTDERSERHTWYMNEKSILYAYTYYYSWWNLVRVTSLFAACAPADFSFLADDSCILDIGSGPLTVPIALWLSRPELRKKKLTVYCLDISAPSLAMGKDLFMAVCARTCENDDKIWKIVAVKGSFGTEIRQKIDFITCSGMFNELFWNSPESLEKLVAGYAKTMHSYTNEKAAFFIAEPGIPRSSMCISLLRQAFIQAGFSIQSPCPHKDDCCMNAKKNKKWCHFVLQTEKNIPQKLQTLSKKSELQKDRAAVSFIFAHNFWTSAPIEKKTLQVRVTSDIIYLPENKCGRYACSAWGLLLLTGNIAIYPFGSLIQLDFMDLEQTISPATCKKDPKTGAIIIQL